MFKNQKMNIAKGIDVNIKFYRQVDIDKYIHDKNEVEESSENMGVVLPEPEIPDYKIGKMKLDPTKIVFYYEVMSSGKDLDEDFDLLTVCYNTGKTTDDLTVMDSYEGLTKKIEDWYKKNKNHDS